MAYLRQNHNLPTWVLFADLVKAFDTSNNFLMMQVLGRYRCPHKFQLAIERMYKYSVVRLIISEIYSKILFQVGVKQSNSSPGTIPLHYHDIYRYIREGMCNTRVT